MPAFDTPQPVSVAVDLVAGDIRVVASERTNSIVEVRPRNKSNEVDVRAAEQARVEYNDGKLTVKGGKRLQHYFTRTVGAFDVTMEVPTGSHVRAQTVHGDLFCEGRLGQCWLKTIHGDISLDAAEAIQVSTLHGQINVTRVAGDSAVRGSGDVRIQEIGGKASIQNLNGDSWVGKVAGEISVSSAHGDISVDQPGSNVSARTAFGNVHVGEIARGTIVLQTASGDVEIGIRQGTAAWLDVKSSSGAVRNSMEATDHPEPTDETAEVRARTFDGDIVICRAATA